MSNVFTFTEINELASSLEEHNKAYRAGRPVISDAEYDRLVERLRRLDPENPFLRAVEPEKFDSKREVRHPEPMLSIEKAYGKAELERFVARAEKEAEEIGGATPEYVVTVKLDGLAGRDDGEVFVTRGNGEAGYEISEVFEKGVRPLGGRGLGLGEIVVVKSYFFRELSDTFTHPRNMIAGLVASDTLNEVTERALKDGVIHFVPYGDMGGWTGSGAELLENIDEISRNLLGKTDYPADGVVVSVTDEEIRRYMGATVHHYRWQIAVKSKGATARTRVNDIIWQVGRTGSITPVLSVEPVLLSGAVIKRVTGHNAGFLKKRGAGIGAEIEIIRSGEVIPKLEKVISGSEEFNWPVKCPECDFEPVLKRDFLKCEKRACPGQVRQSIVHWFKTLGNADWFGVESVRKLVDNGFDSLEKIYSMKEGDFAGIGFGPVQSANLAEAVLTSMRKPVEDWRFLSAFGIPDLGKGDAGKLLDFVKLEDLAALKVEDLEKIYGFGAIKSKTVCQGIKRSAATIEHMLALGFNVISTAKKDGAAGSDSSLLDKKIVFTGKMSKGTRSDMEAEARAMGAMVQKAVSGKTDWLVCGENPGGSKVKKAEKLGVGMLDEDEYRLRLQAGNINGTS